MAPSWLNRATRRQPPVWRQSPGSGEQERCGDSPGQGCPEHRRPQDAGTAPAAESVATSASVIPPRPDDDHQLGRPPRLAPGRQLRGQRRGCRPVADEGSVRRRDEGCDRSRVRHSRHLGQAHAAALLGGSGGGPAPSVESSPHPLAGPVRHAPLRAPPDDAVHPTSVSWSTARSERSDLSRPSTTVRRGGARARNLAAQPRARPQLSPDRTYPTRHPGAGTVGDDQHVPWPVAAHRRRVPPSAPVSRTLPARPRCAYLARLVEGTPASRAGGCSLAAEDPREESCVLRLRQPGGVLPRAGRRAR